MTPFDETWHRLLDWTQGQPPSERLAALLLKEEVYDVIGAVPPDRSQRLSGLARNFGDVFVGAVMRRA